jgi:HEAT repeat protein
MKNELIRGTGVALFLGLLSGCAGPNAGGAKQNQKTIQSVLVVDPPVLRDEAMAFLESMRRDEYALYRANAIEALQIDPEAGEKAAREGIEDTNLAVRFVSAYSIGKYRYQSSAPLVYALLRDESDSVRAAATLALKMNGQNVSLGPLSEMLKNSNPTTAGNAALVLGEIGEASAIGLLRDALDYSPATATQQQHQLVRLQIAEAMSKLGDPTASARIRSQLYSRGPQDGELTAIAATMLGDLDATRTIPDLKVIVASWRQYRLSAEIRLAALKSLAQMGDPLPMELVLEYLETPFQDENLDRNHAIRAQAVHVLGYYPVNESLPYLAAAFEGDPRPMVRLQAAAAIVRLVPEGGSGSEESVADLLTPDDLP